MQNANDSSDPSHTLPDSWDTPKFSVLCGCGRGRRSERRRGVRELLHVLGPWLASEELIVLVLDGHLPLDGMMAT